MKTIFKTIALGVTLVSLSLITKPSLADDNAPTGTDGNYIGVGLSAGVTNGGQTGDAATLGGNVQGRYTLENAPVSLRGSVLFTDENSAIIPTISYDLPITNNMNAYLGLGYAFVVDEGNPTPLGNQDSLVLTLGGEAEVGSNVMVYGDTKWGIDSYQNSPASAVSLQAGVGYTFK